MTKTEKAIELFDAHNRKDPRTIQWNGTAYPTEYAYALMLHQWVLTLEPTASEALLLASRSQHIGRWEITRGSYPEGRVAYLQWRRDVAAYHADKAMGLMRQAGVDQETIEKVKQINLKKGIKNDREVQVMENALCLVFLEFQFEEFRQRYLSDPEKIINILYRSLLKMDDHGRAVALLLTYSADGLELIKQALARLNKAQHEPLYRYKN